MKKENIVVWLLGLATLAVLSLQVFLSSETTTKTESTLFGILQFLLSLGFAWVLAKQASQQEFESKQRKFAIAAFRRIKEIEAQTEHLISRLDKAIEGSKENHGHELDIAKTLAISIYDTTSSSKLDWADIIGDQIEVIEKIENIQRKSLAQVTNSQPKSEETKNINALKEELSTELKLSLDNKEKKATSIQIAEEMKENDCLILNGFIDGNWSSARDVKKLVIGELLDVRIVDVEGRIATLAAYDKNNQFVGSFLNNYGNTYDEFTRAACVAAGASSFEGKVIKISNDFDESDEEWGMRMLFTLSVTPKNKEVSLAPSAA
ncbi:hypothetical protein [Photobacterium leiognathi]|uniref:hypothetical protein n=1 Tax=Photobacterium leiognathi TaxID=553611 RepID=UPI002981BED2|nr:hypothetical protein [Photobacterium leiognathi]